MKALPHPWQNFAPKTIAQLIGEGKVVFVNVTAEWCLTCKANELTVLRQDDIVTLLADPTTVAMQADWTRPDSEIARYLASFGRYGIPFDVVYGPSAPQGIILPEILTDGALSDAVAQARHE
ncbi:MAG: thioredoxin family protein [Alphaproteobacteria bacterium]